MINKQPVDAVITWVDGSDSSHAAKLNRLLASLGRTRPMSAAPTRFNQCGELSYCVFSLLQFAPWINNIFIITDQQIPPIVEQLAMTTYANKIKIIDHLQIFADYEHVLPTFNSLTIETMLFKIPDLADKFIYLNDDCLLVRPVSYDDFFRSGKVVLRGCWKTSSSVKTYYKLTRWLNKYFPKLVQVKPPAFHRHIQEKSGQLLGFTKRFFDLPHMPFAMNKPTIDCFFRLNPQLLSSNIQYALRDLRQFWLISLIAHLEINNNQAIIDKSLKAMMVNGGHHSIKKIKSRLAAVDSNPHIAFLCMQSIDLAPDDVKDYLIGWLKGRFDINSRLFLSNRTNN
ncbi:MAG: Stealth CR1 domain-containing protein [Legionella sp.]